MDGVWFKLILEMTCRNLITILNLAKISGEAETSQS